MRKELSDFGWTPLPDIETPVNRGRMDKRVSRAGSTLVVAVLGALSLAPSCGPTDPPGCPSCPSGTVAGCAGDCQTPVPIGGACSANACAANGRCVDGASCIGGTCTNLGLSLGSVCPTKYPNDPCPADLFCKGIHCLPPNTPFTGPICASPSGLNSSCDGDLTKTTATSACSPCNVGLRCVGVAPGVQGKCHDTCAVDADCPCGAGQRCSTGLTTDPPAPDGTCFNCKQVADECSAQNPCCDGTKCAPAADGVVRCCKPKGEVCIVNRECCKGTVCRLPAPPPPGVFAPGTCDACAVSGESCRVSDECCEGSCVSGVCKKSCSPGAACSVAGAKGECAKGKTECDALGNATCVGPNPVPESCNGKDDDCDGKVDNLAPESCTTTPTGCQDSFSVSGSFACSGTSKVCKPTPSSWCGEGGGVSCGNSIPGGGGYCGTCAATPCTLGGVAPCVPNTQCKEDPPGSGTHCIRRDGCGFFVPKCWRPAQLDSCCVTCAP